MEGDPLSKFEEHVMAVEAAHFMSLYLNMKEKEGEIRFHEMNGNKAMAEQALEELLIINQKIDDEEKRLSILPENDNEDSL